jgi:hypothetical protein
MMGRMKLSCKKTKELLFEFLENSATPEIKRAMDAHLEVCKPCAQFVDSYKKTSELCRKAMECACPAELGAKLLACLRAEAAKLKR